MSDKVGGYRTKHREDWGSNSGEKKDYREEGEELQIDTEYRHIRHRIKGEPITDNQSVEDREEKQGNESEDHSKSEKFSDEYWWASYGFREEEVDSTSFDLSIEHPPTQEKDDKETSEFDKWESEVIEHTLDLAEGEGSKKKGNQEKYDSEEDNQGEEFIAYNLTKGIEGDIPHSEGGGKVEMMER